MNKETMTVHEAMAELKMLKKRIASKQNGTYVAVNKHSNKKINGKEIDEFIKDIDSEYQSVEDMWNRYFAIKKQLSLSNAKTIVKIAGKDYTVAEAIEMKRDSGIDIKFMIDVILNQYATAQKECIKKNNALEEKADTYVSQLYGTKDKAAADEVMAVRKTYIDTNSVEVVTGTDLIKKINARKDALDKFMTEVDAKLSISNATTFITIEY